MNIESASCGEYEAVCVTYNYTPRSRRGRMKQGEKDKKHSNRGNVLAGNFPNSVRGKKTIYKFAKCNKCQI